MFWDLSIVFVQDPVKSPGVVILVPEGVLGSLEGG